MTFINSTCRIIYVFYSMLHKMLQFLSTFYYTLFFFYLLPPSTKKWRPRIGTVSTKKWRPWQNDSSTSSSPPPSPREPAFTTMER